VSNGIARINKATLLTVRLKDVV